jgi:6,7-dimethyl-8-ribityllumazine synthase
VTGQGRLAGRVVDAAGLDLAIAATRWYPEVTESLLRRAVAAANACGIASPLVVRVPGAVELPVVAAELAVCHDAVVCLGAVVQGGTPHFDYVCDAVTYGLARVPLDTGTPVGNGVLTCGTLDQAIDRCGREGSSEDKGWDAVIAALETARVLSSLRVAQAACDSGRTGVSRGMRALSAPAGSKADRTAGEDGGARRSARRA